MCKDTTERINMYKFQPCFFIYSMETCAIIIMEVNAMENGYTLIFETWTFKWRLRNTIIKKGFKQTFAI